MDIKASKPLFNLEFDHALILRSIMALALCIVPLITWRGLSSPTTYIGFIAFTVAAYSLIWERWFKYLFLICALFIWVIFIDLITALLHPFGIVLAACFLLLSCTLLFGITVTVGKRWGHKRLADMRASGRPMIENRWVYIKHEDALALKSEMRIPFSVIVICIYIGILVLADSLTLILFFEGFAESIFLSITFVTITSVLIGLKLLTIWWYYKKAPAAYPMTILWGILSFPISVPILFMLADSEPINMIYRHRYAQAYYG